jgi:hypothetical protein
MPPRRWEAFFASILGLGAATTPPGSSFSAQQLWQGLGVLWFATPGAFGVFDHAFGPGLPYTVPGIGLDRFDH